MQDTASYLARLSPEQRRLFISKLNYHKTTGPPADRIRSRRTTTPAPLSFAQERLWFLDRLEGPNAAYNIPLAWRLSGRLHVEALEKSIRFIVQRHEALRTQVIMENGEPWQVFPAHPDITLPVTDLSNLPEPECRVEIEHRIEAEDLTPFGTLAAPLVRAGLIRIDPRHHILLLTFHHMVFDGWSLGILARELSAAYPALCAGTAPPLPEPMVQYADFALWQRERFRQGPNSRLNQGLAFWKQYLAGAPFLLDLSPDRPHPSRRSYRGRRHTFTIPGKWITGLKMLARQEGVTLFMALLAVYALLLSRYTGQRDMVIGTSVAGRDRPELEPLIGFFINTLALRIRIQGNPGFRQLLGHVRQMVLDARAHQEIPFEKIVEVLAPERNLSHTPLFNAAFVLQNMPMTEPGLPGLDITPLETDRLTAKFDIHLIAAETRTGLWASLEYNTDIFDADTISRMVRHFQYLLEAVIADPQRPILELPLMTPDQASLCVQPKKTAGAATPAHRTFEARAALAPDAVALIFDRQRLSYGQVNEQANQLARYLQTMGVGPEIPVAILLDRTPDLIIAILAVLKAAGAYIPLDPDIPEERLRFIIENSRAAVVVTDQTSSSLLFPENTTVIRLDRDKALIDRMAPDNPDAEVHPDNLAYIIYTSGSTGTPKGSLVTHRNVARLFETTRPMFHFSEKDVFTLFHSCAFDFSVWEIWGALLHGGALVIVPYMISRSPNDFHTLLCRENVTVLNQTPSAFGQLIAADEQAEPGQGLSLEWVIFGGEALEPRMLRPWFAKHGDCRPKLVNMYGITETTVHVTWHRLTIADTAQPGSMIGSPIPDLGLHVLDAYMNPVPPGIKGEIYVEGPGICRGYLGRPDLTAGAFIPNPFGDSGSRLYKTGDTARLKPDNRIEYLGRKDRQIKIRGFRIELGEIETVLCRYPGVSQAVVMLHGEPENSRLAAWLVCRTPVDDEKLRDFLKNRLPAYMIPAVFTQLDTLPLTANNKIDRRRLPEPRPAAEGRPYTPPKNRTEHVLADIWRRLLKQDRIGRHDDFFSMGGHSLLAVRVLSRVREAFQVDPPVSVLFEEPTIAGLAAWIEQTRTDDMKGNHPNHPDDHPHPLSFAQERLWFLDRLAPRNIAYNVPAALRLTGTLNAAALEKSFQDILRRHDILRTCFPSNEEGEPVQTVVPAPAALIRKVDSGSFDNAEKSDQVTALLQKEAETPFDLASGPLLRVVLFCLAPRDHILMITMHHIVSDGWSMGVLVSELSAFYTAHANGEPCPLPDLPIQYADTARRQRENFAPEAYSREDLAFWKNQLRGAPALVDLPFDRPRPTMQSFSGAMVHFNLDTGLTRDLIRISRESGGTLFMTLLSAFSLLLHRYSHQKDLVIGTPVANRDLPETEALIGFFVNTLALRLDLSKDLSVSDLLKQVRQTTLDALSHQTLPFERLVQALQPERNLSYNPLFQVMFVLQNAPLAPLELPGLRVDPMDIAPRAAKMDLTLSLRESTQGLEGALEYNTDLFQDDTARRMIRHFHMVLRAMAAAPHEKISRLPLLDDAERRKILFQWGAGPTDSSPDGWVCDDISRWVRKTPHAPALIFETRIITYQDLETRTNRLASRLRQLGIGPEKRVGIMLERGPDMVVAILAVLKSGGTYVPLDPDYPSQRLDVMIRDARPCVLITHKTPVFELSPYPVRIIHPEDGMDDAPGDHSHEERTAVQTPDNLAYMIYTSGTTGMPKGVMISHQGLANLARAHIRRYHVTSDSRVLQFASFAFDASVSELIMTLCAGAALIMADPQDMLPGPDLARLLRDQAVTHVTLPPSALAVMPEEHWPHWQTLIVAGEACPPDLARQWVQGRRLINGYGPTECTVCATTHAYAPEEEQLPVGRPMDHMRVYIVNHALEPVPPGVAGELLIGGPGLARGYWGRPGLTAEKFIPDPFSREPGARLYTTGDLARFLPDGCIEYLGRRDHQVKIRGFRVEPGEVEAVLNRHPAVRAVVVTARQGPDKTMQLCAYIVLHPRSTPLEVLRDHLRASLPGYMVPSSFVILDALPLTPNGKIDRNALPDNVETRCAGSDENEHNRVEPRNPGERMVADIWTQVLALPRVGIHDNFFDLGGHSLLATRIMSRLSRVLGVELPVRALFESPTVAGLWGRLQDAGHPSAAPAPPVAPVPRRCHHPLSFAQERLWFLDQLVPDNPFYNIATALRLKGNLDREALDRALTEVVRRHESLRTIFGMVDGKPVQIITPAGHVCMTVKDLTDQPPEERSAKIRALALQEARRSFDLGQDPLMRATLIESRKQAPDKGAATDEHVLLITLHHIAADGWSMGVLVRELTALYRAFTEGRTSPLPHIKVQYADFAEWQREWLQGTVLRQQLDYWRQQLEGAPPLLVIPIAGPTDRTRPPVQTFNGDGVPLSVGADLTARLRHISRKADASLFMTLLAAFNLLLSRYTGRDDIVVGSPVANRNRQEIEPLIGFFVNTLVLRNRLCGDPEFQTLLAQVRQTCLDAYAHQDLPFEKLVDELAVERHLSHNPLVQVAFALQNASIPPLELPGLRVEPLETDVYSVRMDLEVHLWETGKELHGHIMFDADVFDRNGIERLANHFLVLLEAIAADPDQRISRYPIVRTAERRHLLGDADAVHIDLPKEQCIHRLFEIQADKTPARTAVVSGRERLTYERLNTCANRLARCLIEQAPGNNLLVGICTTRSPDMVIGILAVLKAGGAYVPLDPDTPPKRLADIMTDSRINILLTQAALLPHLTERPDRTICMDRDWAEINSYAATDLERRVDPRDLAYVIHTSGSTGKPKGVMVPHGNVVNFLYGFEHVAPRPTPLKGICVCPFGFDVSVWDLFSNLCFGGELHIIPKRILVDPIQFTDYLVGQDISSTYIPPGLLTAVAERLAQISGKTGLKRLLTGVEPIPGKTLQKFRDLSADMCIINGYGPAEATVCATYYAFTTGLDPEQRTPIGKPAPNCRAFLLDNHLNPVPSGVPGELFIGGNGLSRGYLNQPDLTAERFIPAPFGIEPGMRIYRTGDVARQLPGGRFEFLGRSDNQVKLRGFRIEPGEIESVLCRHPAVARAVVVSGQSRSGVHALAAYMTADLDSRTLQDKLTQWQAEHVSQWQTLYEQTYGRSSEKQDPRFNITGWNSSYTGAPIPAEQMAEWVDSTVALIRSLSPRRVLEIGCGTGLLLSRLAPECETYWGTDFSPAALDRATELIRSFPGLSCVRLLNREARDFTDIPPGGFDIVILNSVVQYFPGVDYLVQVLRGAADALSPGGRIVVGDVRSLPLLMSYIASVQVFRHPSPTDREAFSHLLRHRCDQEDELVLDPRFFQAITSRLPQLGRVRVIPKRGRHLNELTKFRYDVIICKDRAPLQPAAVSWMDWEPNGFDLEQLRSLLSREQPPVLGIKQIPNARLTRENTILQWVADAQGATPLAEFETRESGRPEIGVDPEVLRQLGETLGYHVTLSWLAADPQGHIDAIFQRNDHTASDVCFPRPVVDRPLESLANNRLTGRLNRMLAPELRAFAGERLPDYMVPGVIMFMESLPMTPHGKVDRSALPIQATPCLESGKGGLARTPAEKQLAAIWQEALGLTTVGIHDNFFELGGDSIIGIQVISQAHQQGMTMTARDLYQHQTIAELACSVTTRTPEVRPPAPVTGPAPLTPVQQDFLSGNPVNPHHFNQSVLLTTAPELGAQILKQALDALIMHHETLRTRFSRNGDSWQQEAGQTNHASCFSEKDLSTMPAKARATALTAHCSALQKELDIIHGPLVRAAFFNFGPGLPGRLFVTIHHLVVDGVSWRILLEDLQTACSQLMSSRPVALPSVTVSFGQWTRRLHTYAREPARQAHADFWLDLAGSTQPPLPLDPIPGQGQNTRESADQVRVRLDMEQTLALIRETPPKYNTGMNDVLLAALWQTLTRWTSRDTIRIDLEGHGRSDLFPDLDLSRTVGWFTAIFPVTLQCCGPRTEPFAAGSQGVILKTVKEHLRRISNHAPDGGLGFGLLTRIAGHPALSALPRPDISFNYLGQFNAPATGNALFEPAPEPTGSFQDECAARPYVLEINTSVVRGELLAEWTYSRNLHYRQTITRLADDFIRALKSIIIHCRQPDAGGFTPADFPEAGLSQADLDELMQDIEGIDE